MSPHATTEKADAGIHTLGPVPARERVTLLDVLRGVAILGILLVNNNLNVGQVQVLYPSTGNILGQSTIDILGLWKFWPLFALLFGVGLAIQLERAEARGHSVLPLYLRRLFFLAVFGFLLEPFINVAFLYFLAVAGFSALFIGFLLRRRNHFWVLLIAACLLAVNLGTEIRGDPPDGGVPGPPNISAAEVTARTEQFRAIIHQNEAHAAIWSGERLVERIGGILQWYKRQLFGGILGTIVDKTNLVFYMLVGIFLWRTGVLRNAEKHRPFFRKLFLATLLIGLPVSVYTTIALHNEMLTLLGLGSHPTQLQQILKWPLWAVSSIGISLTYLAGFALLIKRKGWGYLEGAFAPVGRMALTNYALQALLAAFVFGNYTPGIPRTSLGVWPAIGVLVGLFILQVLFSRAWLRSFSFGPLEWAWRSLTYWRLQPLRADRPE